MSATAAPQIASPLDSLVDEYLRVLANERGASAHTLRAYQRELRGFAAFMAERLRQRATDRGQHRAHAHPRLSGHAL